MNKLQGRSLVTIQQLEKKTEDNSCRMPSIVKIHELLEDVGIKHWFYESENNVETRSGSNTYVNSRHDGKKGYEIKIEDYRIYMDTSDSYYSWNSQRYAEKLIECLRRKGVK